VTPARGSGRPLAILAAAQAAGQAGTWAAYVAALPAALAAARPATAVSAVTAAWGIPWALARLAGPVIDRHGPRVTAAASWAAAALAALVPVAQRPGLAGQLAVLAVLAAAGTAGVAAGEVAPSWMPGRPDLARAGTWLVIATSVPLAAGPSAAAGVIAAAGDRGAWALAAALCAAAAAASLAVPAARPAGAALPAGEPGGRTPGRVRGVYAVTAAVFLTYGLITVLEPLYVGRVLHGPLTVYGWLLAVQAAAGAGAAVAAGRRPPAVTGRWAVPVSALAAAAAETAYLATSAPAVAFAGAAAFGAASALFRLACRAVIVQATPPRAHGRALSTWQTIQDAAHAAPAVFTGPLITAAGLRPVLDATSILAATAGTVIALRTRHPGHPARPLPTPLLAAPVASDLTEPGTGLALPTPPGPAANPPGRHAPRPGGAGVAFVAHCLLNQNAKASEGAYCQGISAPVLDALRDQGWRIEQMPCPELAFAGLNRWWMVREQLDTVGYRRHCRKLADTIAARIAVHTWQGRPVVLIGVDGSPSMGVHITLSDPTCGGRPAGSTAQPDLVPGEGILIEELRWALTLLGLALPPAAAETHDLPGHDVNVERVQLSALLTKP